MNKFKSPADQARGSDQYDAASVAEAISSDFSDLVRIFDRQLIQLSEANSHSLPHLSEAKAAAERGLQLSKRLLEVLRASD